MELTEEERRAAGALSVYAVWRQDCFGFGDDRDPAAIFGLFLTKEAAEAEAAARRKAEAPGSFERFDFTGPHLLLALHDERAQYPHENAAVDADKVRAVLALARRQ